MRKTPVKVAYLDFTSMYPTMYTLMHMDRFLKAEKICHSTGPEETP